MGMGLLWYDSSTTELGAKLQKVVKRYQERFGAQPNVCYVHPGTLPQGEVSLGGIRVRPSEHVLKHHFWVGQEQFNDSAS